MSSKLGQLGLACMVATMAALVGCAGPMIAPQELKSLSSARQLQLNEAIVFKYKQGLAVERELALLPGVYQGVGQDGKGAWYLGTPQSMRVTVLDRGGAIGFPKEMIGVPTFASGGLFVPDDPLQAPKVFSIYGEAAKKAPATSDQAETSAIVGTALNAQASNPALAGSSPMASGVSAGVATGVVAGLIALDQADWGKYMISSDQPPQGAELRKHFNITAKP